METHAPQPPASSVETHPVGTPSLHLLCQACSPSARHRCSGTQTHPDCDTIVEEWPSVGRPCLSSTAATAAAPETPCSVDAKDNVIFKCQQGHNFIRAFPTSPHPPKQTGGLPDVLSNHGVDHLMGWDEVVSVRLQGSGGLQPPGARVLEGRPLGYIH